MHELPLVFFTVLAQAAAGAYLILILSQPANGMDERRLSVGILVSMALLSVGMLVGMFHLGVPIRAFNLLAGVGRSPMSNEILLGGAFAGFGILVGLAGLFNKGTAAQRKALRWVTVIFAIAFVATIPKVYQLSTVAAWNTSHTTIQMLASVFITGGALAAVLGAFRHGAAVSIAAVFVTLALRFDYITFVTGVEPILAAEQSALWVTQAVTLLIGGALAFFALMKQKSAPPLLLSACGLVIVGELVGRVSFYNLWAITM
ncbi:dimethyl sulfoxide reductase anchor subunit family protein [Photobacterium rosenbergii]|uniref:dimethyl sulfoxide reductase anchor subunit family protein n=1 Tax=Photobacterium rosenbergii TaxID=294936 RepID=UPI001C99141E|nr:DmsC/YnfH family molybdoenzyme membrane anchor subunit [Photobacterium rosenbergii]MBY5946937.1 dimethyl sulfoxide reductase anchor subunit [Photobacterium rosenbergii]